MQNHIHCNNTITEAQKVAWMREGAERERERIRREIMKLPVWCRVGIVWVERQKVFALLDREGEDETP